MFTTDRLELAVLSKFQLRATLTARGVVEMGSPDDLDDDEEMTTEEHDELGNSLFVKEEKENINTFGERTMGTQA